MAISLIFKKDHLVFGCGNPLLGDDGFGPAVIEYMQHHCRVPENAALIDAGTSIRDILFDILLSSKKPKQIIIVDAADQPHRRTGDIFEIDVDQISPAKINDFSLHQFPTTNMLKELQEGTRIDVRVLVVQTGAVPDEVRPGLSKPVEAAIPDMSQRILTLIKEDRDD